MKRIISIIFLLFFYHCCFSQKTHSDSIVYVKEYVTAKILSVYIPDYLAKNKNETKKRNRYNLIKTQLETNSLVSPLPFDTLVSLLGNDFLNTKDEFVNVVRQIKTDSFDSVITKIFAINVLKFSNANTLHDKLSSEIIDYNKNVNIEQEANRDSGKDTTPKNDTNLNNFSFKLDLLNIIIISLFFLIILSFIFLIRINNRLTRHRVEIEDLKSSGKSNMIPNYQGVPSDIRLLKDRVTELEKNQKQLENTISQNDLINKKPQQQYTEPNYRTLQPEDRNISDQQNITKQETTIFYMTSPIGELFYSNSKSMDYRKGFAMYKFYLQSNKNESLFDFISDDETIKMIRNNEMGVIRPACKMENDPTQNTTKVITTERGIARLEGDNWKIIKKAIIKFE